MKMVILFLASAVILFSCKKEYEREEICIDRCTVIHGKVISQNNKPIANVKFSFSYTDEGYFPNKYSNSRNIISGKTDENGEYTLSFFLRDNEIGRESKGYFTLSVDKNSFDRNKYVVFDGSSIKWDIYSTLERDTIIVKDLYIPRKTSMAIHLNGFKPIKPDDEFDVRMVFAWGDRLPDNRINEDFGVPFSNASTGYTLYSGDPANYTGHLEVARNDTSIVELFKVKNGIMMFQKYKIFVPDSPNFELSFDY